MKKYTNVLAAVAIIGAIITVVLTFVWFQIVTMTANMPTGERAYTVEALALQITILEMFLAVFGIILGIGALFGYIGIKSAAENKAEDVAKEVANERMERFIMQQGSSAQTLRDAGPPVASKAEAPHDATAVSGGE